jgi:hypothetical protein
MFYHSVQRGAPSLLLAGPSAGPIVERSFSLTQCLIPTTLHVRAGAHSKGL